MKIKQTSMVLKTSISFLLCYLSILGFSQNLNLEGNWENIGPTELPLSDDNPSAGIGPVEFIRISETNPDHMLAGSLYGGLFFSHDGGDLWVQSGSDQWNYSGCAWANFHPTNEKAWFAVSNEQAKKGKPGKIGKLGGVFRSLDQGATWESIADYSDFNHNSYVVIYGTRFHPNVPNKLYVLTSLGLFFTEDCTVSSVEWSKVGYLDGSVYDLEVAEERICVSYHKKGQWQVIYSEGHQLLPIEAIKNETRKISHITIETVGNKFYLLIDFAAAKDEIWLFDPVSNSVKTVCNRGRISFGSGYTFAVNPFNTDEVMLGNGVRVRKWLISEQKFYKVGSDYHVDVEHVAYHPKIENKIYIATHGGVYVTENNGESWTFKSKGMGNAEVLGLAVSDTDPNQIAVGLNHDGSLVRADWDKDGQYRWRFVNGGDALLPLINPSHPNVVYTSNQYTSGGMYYSDDTAKHITNIHTKSGLKTSGWAMAGTLHPVYDSVLFFNYSRPAQNGITNIDAARTVNMGGKTETEIISNFGTSHGLKKYQVFSLFNSKHHPDLLLAYVIDFVKDDNGKSVTNHRLFKLNNIMDTSTQIINAWKELELPRNGWVGDIVMDPKKWFKMYVSYVAGERVSVEHPDEKGMVFYAKYKKSSLVQTRNWDISLNIPSGDGGKYNLVYASSAGKIVFVATKSGVYMGTKSTIRGGRHWQKVGYGLPHCKVYGLHYHAETKLLTVGLKGRGVWRINLNQS